MNYNQPRWRLSWAIVPRQVIVAAIIIGSFWLNPNTGKFIFGLAAGWTLHALSQNQQITLAIQLIVIILSFVIGAKLFN